MPMRSAISLSVDDFINRAGPDNQGRRHAQIGPAFGTVEQEVPGEVEDDLGAAGGQDALAAVCDVVGLRIPERTNGLVERGGGDALQVEQGDLEGRYSTGRWVVRDV